MTSPRKGGGSRRPKKARWAKWRPQRIKNLLHSPLLDEAGLVSALRWYVEGFGRRSKIEVELEFPASFRRFTQELETAIFRIVQECLTNIHRHSGSGIAKLRIAQNDGVVEVEVEDRGKGIPPGKLAQMDSAGMPGVGIQGMRERIHQLNGVLDIHSNGQGTTIRARLPIANASTGAA